MTETTLEENNSTETPSVVADRNSGSPAPDKRGIFKRSGAPLLPEAGAGGAPLMAVIGVISFLAALALSALLIINAAADSWMAGLRAELTVQVKGIDRTEIDTGVEAALRILNDTDGVIEASVRGEAETAALLDPWLGKDNAAAFIAIPALIEIKVTPEARDNLDLLRTRLASAAPNATLDDHAGWHGRLSAAARSGQALALAVFVLVMGAACAISIFAARAGLAANHEIVSVLHLVGATDAFIAGEVQRRFFVLGLRGALTGLLAAVIALFLAGSVIRANPNAGQFLPEFSFSVWLLVWLLSVPLITCLITAVTARLTVLSSLREQY